MLARTGVGAGHQTNPLLMENPPSANLPLRELRGPQQPPQAHRALCSPTLPAPGPEPAEQEKGKVANLELPSGATPHVGQPVRRARRWERRLCGLNGEHCLSISAGKRGRGREGERGRRKKKKSGECSVCKMSWR